MTTYVVVQHGVWLGVECDIELEAEAASAFLTAAHAYVAETGRPMPEIVEPLGGLRTIAQTTEMQWAFDHKGTAASDAIYLKYNMSRVSTARPSINGTHTTGRFFDVATSAFLTWLLPKADGGKGNGARFGITRPLPNDPNHCRYTPGTATAALTVTSLAVTSTSNKKGTPAMYVRRVSTGVVSFFNGTGQHDFSSLADYATHVSILSTYNAQPANAGDQQFVPPADPGQVMGLDETGWASMVAKYGAPVGSGGSGPTVAQIADGVDAKLAPRFDAIPNAAQLGQALTSTVSLVNGHTDQLKVARTLPAIP